MKFRIRDGFNLFKSPDEALSYQCQGARSGIVPRAKEGDIVELTTEELASIKRQRALGKLEPIDKEAHLAYGKTQPLTADPMAGVKLPEPKPAFSPLNPHGVS